MSSTAKRGAQKPERAAAAASSDTDVDAPRANGALVAQQTRAVVVMAAITLAALFAAGWAMSGALRSSAMVFSVDAKGAVVPAVPITQPFLSESRVIAFAEECLRRAWAHDFVHYEKTLPQAMECFTPEAGDLYMQAMGPYVKTMTQHRMVMGALVNRVPRVVRFRTEPSAQGPVPIWEIEAEIGVFFEGKGERIPPSRLKVQLTVRRVPLESTPRGVQIDVFFVLPP